MDIAFAVGGYGPDAEAIFRKQKEFIVTFLKSYRHPIRNGLIRVAIISYDSKATIVKNLNEKYAVENLESLVNRLALTRRGIAAEQAFSVAANNVFNQQSDERRRVMLLFTDFTSADNMESVRNAIELLRVQGVSVIALGTGNKVSISHLVSMETGSKGALIAESSKTMMFYYFKVYRRILQCKFAVL